MRKRYLLAGMILTIFLVSAVALARKQVSTQPEENVEVASLKAKGSVDAPIKIQEFTNFTCPACKKSQVELKKLFSKYPGKIYLSFRHFPLLGHGWALPAHQAAECASRQGQFWAYHDKLWKGMDKLTEPKNPTGLLLSYAKDLGLDLGAFSSCLADEAVRADVMKEKEIGTKAKVTATPTFFIEGERLVGAKELEEKGENLIRSALGLAALPPKKAEKDPAVKEPHG